MDLDQPDGATIRIQAASNLLAQIDHDSNPEELVRASMERLLFAAAILAKMLELHHDAFMDGAVEAFIWSGK